MTFQAFKRLWRGEAVPAASVGGSFKSAARTHIGAVRSVNEDRVFARAERGLWAVADGMGGHALGGAAAEASVAGLAALADTDEPITAEAIIAALTAANQAIFDGVTGSGATSGSTIVALHLAGRRALLFWAGDSRAYRVRRGATEQLTTDHSLVQELVDAGLLSAAQSSTHPRANVITRALGVAASVEIDTIDVAVEPGDLFVLCSDGLSRSLGLGRIAAATAGASLDEAAEALVAGALTADGSDNISVVLIRA